MTGFEYLRQDEHIKALHPIGPVGFGSTGWSFTLGGHRLSSLYRSSVHTVLTLNFGKPAFILGKILHGGTGV